ncbi:MAG: acetate--CoA ligase family protein [bacterium]|nr:acetate--CoA ligase family protein [Betaproteobacteria bacterium]
MPAPQPEHYLDRILNPRSILIVGASKDPVKRGNRAIQSLVADGYAGTIIPINPRETEILGFAAYPSITDAPGELDLAVVCTAAHTVKAVIEECGRRKVKGAILLAAGFSEIGEQGRILEDEVVALARHYGVRLIGPNTNGMFSARLGCNAWGLPDIPRGPLGLLSNSANCVTSIVMQARTHGFMGINTMLSVGNQADIEFHEYLECLGEDPAISAVMLYLEGFKNAAAFREVARRTTQKKPVVMYVAGRTSEGKRAAKSHSGSLAGAYAINRGALRQSGVTVVERLYHLYPVAEALSLFPSMRGRRVAVVSEGGGPLTVAADALVEQGLVLAQLSQETQARIHAVVPNATAIDNPVDAGGGTDPRAEYYGPIVRAILEDPAIDAVLIVGLLGGYADRFGPQAAPAEHAVCAELGAMMREYGKPVIVQSHYADMKTQSLRILREAGVPFQRHVEVAVQCLASAADASAARARNAAAAGAAQSMQHPAPAAVRIIDSAMAEGRDLLETEARDLLIACGIAMPGHLLLRSVDDAAAAIDRFGDSRLAMKVVSADILHKSEAQGVLLGLQGAGALREGWRKIAANAESYHPGARLEGMLVTPMAPRGTEFIIGITDDPQHGPVMLFGLGGVFVEVIGDVVFRALPLTTEDALDMIGSLKHSAVLDGVRGAAPVDRAALADLLVRLSRVRELHPQIAEIDLNPVIAHDGGQSVVDARIVLRRNVSKPA